MAEATDASNLKAFLSGFVLPLVSGGDVHVGAPISVGTLDELAGQLPLIPETIFEIDQARSNALSGVVLSAPLLSFGYEDLSLAAAVHNLLFLAHPRVTSTGISTKQMGRVLDHSRALCNQTKPDDVDAALARHGLLANVFRFRRADVQLSWWAGSESFRGQRPPKRLTTLRALRRVREETQWVGFSELFSSSDVRTVLAALLRGSPLTQLLAAEADSPVLHWEDATFLLRDAELSRAVCYYALGAEEPRERLLTPARFAAAFEQMLERSPTESDVRAVTAFLVYLNVLLLSDASTHSSLWDLLAPEHAASRPRGLSFLSALPGAAARVDPCFEAPRGMSAAELLSWRAHRERLSASVGEAAMASAEHLLREFLRPQLSAG